VAETIILYDRTGAAIAYTLEDGETLYTYGGRPVGYIHEDAIFSFQGRILGWYLDGWVVDFDGMRVFFSKDSQGGPARPIRGIPPIRGIRQYCPGRAGRFGKGLKPAFSLLWSPRSGGSFFGETTFVGVKSDAPRPGRPAAVESEAAPAEPVAQDAAAREPGAGSEQGGGA
jgi:hypothetical protein